MSPAEERNVLMDMLVRRSLRSGGRFKLSSGSESTVYVDAKQTAFLARAMPLIGRAFLRKMKECGWSPEAVGGRTLGADPIGISIARESLDCWDNPIDAFAVRKEPKGHGMKQTVEGLDEPRRKHVVIVEDVCTGGGSTGDAIEKARDSGMEILGAICLVDREQGAREFLEKNYGCRLESIFTLSELEAHRNRHEATLVPVGAHP
jgi:orotate phosphoribosyltransferase